MPHDARNVVQQPFPDERHDHDACRSEALAQVVAACAERGLRLTPGVDLVESYASEGL